MNQKQHQELNAFREHKDKLAAAMQEAAQRQRAARHVKKDEERITLPRAVRQSLESLATTDKPLEGLLLSFDRHYHNSFTSNAMANMELRGIRQQIVQYVMREHDKAQRVIDLSKNVFDGLGIKYHA